MAEENPADIMVATRLSKPLYEKIVQRQREAKRLTGTTPSVSAILRAMVDEAPVRRAKTKAA